MANTGGTYGTDGWFPQGRDAWRLDAITLLAIIGESEIEAHSQAMEASPLCLLPRLLPAPQALLKSSRPLRMPDYPATVTGVYAGVVLSTLGFFANIITPLDDLPAFDFRVIQVRHRQPREEERTDETIAADGKGHERQPAHAADLRPRRRRRGRARHAPGPEEDGDDDAAAADADDEDDADADASGTAPPQERATIPPRWDSPVNLLSALSFAATAAIAGLAAHWRDGVALAAVGAVALGSSVAGYASWWRPVLLVRAPRARARAGDVVVQTAQGGFVLVRCSDAVARELYAGTPECRYAAGARAHKLLMALGTALLMVAVVLLGNVGFAGQTLVGASYLLLNMAYWLAGLLPKEYFWDVASRYEWRDITPQDARHASSTTDPDDPSDGYKSFTRTLWYVIRETKEARWARRSGAAPGTRKWKQWLREAEENAKAGNRRWAAVKRMDDIFANDENEADAPQVDSDCRIQTV